MDPKFQPPLAPNQTSQKKASSESLPEISDNVELPPSYRLEASGPVMKHIVDSKGKVVSRDYMKFEIFKQGGIYAIVASVGAMRHLLKIPAQEDGFFEESPVEFHSIGFNNTIGHLVANIGASSWIVDPLTGDKVHQDPYMYFTKKDGKIYGEWPGASPVEIIFSKDKNTLPSEQKKIGQ